MSKAPADWKKFVINHMDLDALLFAILVVQLLTWKPRRDVLIHGQSSTEHLYNRIMRVYFWRIYEFRKPSHYRIPCDEYVVCPHEVQPFQVGFVCLLYTRIAKKKKVRNAAVLALGVIQYIDQDLGKLDETRWTRNADTGAYEPPEKEDDGDQEDPPLPGEVEGSEA